ncbi:MAG: DUF2442 domain-containing protein [Rhodospirillaceae bacterium]
MGFSAPKIDERVMSVLIDGERLAVDLMDGRTIAVPLAWYPRLFNATSEQRGRWEVAGGGFGIHWPDLDEDLSTEGLLRGARAHDKALPFEPLIPNATTIEAMEEAPAGRGASFTSVEALMADLNADD